MVLKGATDAPERDDVGTGPTDTGQKDAVRVRARAWRGKNAFLKGGADDDGATLN